MTPAQHAVIEHVTSSCGVWDAVHIDEHGLEFCLIAPERDHRHALIVAMNAY